MRTYLQFGGILAVSILALWGARPGGSDRMIAAALETTTPTPVLGTPIPVAPTAAPPGAGQPNICDLPLQTASGGSVVTFQNIQLVLPATGDYVIQPILVEGATNRLRICHKQTGGVITFDAQDGTELSRSGTDATGNAILDQIVGGVSLVSTGHAVRPPGTGNAGLRSVRGEAGQRMAGAFSVLK
jgi:hypothetical protein